MPNYSHLVDVPYSIIKAEGVSQMFFLATITLYKTVLLQNRVLNDKDAAHFSYNDISSFVTLLVVIRVVFVLPEWNEEHV